MATIGKLIELLPEPTKSVVVLIVFGSLRIGEVLALRWCHIQADRITVEGAGLRRRVSRRETEAGERGSAVRQARVDEERPDWEMDASKHRLPDDLVSCTRNGGPLGRRNLLRYIKVATAKVGLSSAVDFSELPHDALQPHAARRC